MSPEQIKALLTLIAECQKTAHTGYIQLNWFKGQVGTVQTLTSLKMDALEAIYGEEKKV